MNATLWSRRQFLARSAAFAALSGRLAAAGNSQSPGRIRVGCQANGFALKPGDFPALLAALRQMKALDYAGFECNIRFVQGQFSRLAEARRQIEDTGVALISGTAIIMSSTGKPDAVYADAEGWRRKVARLEALGRTCRAGGLKLAYHNHNPEFSNGNAQMNALAQMSDPRLVWFLMDAGHAHLGGGDPAAFLRTHSRRLFGCHLKTFRGGQAHQVPLGQGDWGFEDLAAAICETDWSGWLLTEEGGLAAPPDTAALGPDRDYIQRVFGA
jgi:sugar phosphate isomerase/epimerase